METTPSYAVDILINGKRVGGIVSGTLEEIRELVDCTERSEHSECSYCSKVDWFMAYLRQTGEAMYTDYNPSGEPGVDVVVGYVLPVNN